MLQDLARQDIVARHITATIHISAVQLARRIVIVGADGYLRIKEMVKKMQYELWRFRDKSGKMGQIYLLNPKSPLDRVNRKDIMESGGVCVGRLVSELDERQLMEGFTYSREKAVFSLREVFAKLDKDLKDTKYTPETARVRAKAVIWEVLESFKYVDRMRARECEGESPYPNGDMSIEVCPCCGSEEYLHNQDENQNEYCGQCGQRIKWD